MSIITTDEIATKPPIGVIPRGVFYAKRFNELSRAIREYQEALLKIDPEWIEEYNSLIDLLSIIKK